jgi:hypothetical protein
MQIQKLSCGTKRQILLQRLHSNQEMKKMVLFATLQIYYSTKSMAEGFSTYEGKPFSTVKRGQQIKLLSSLHRYIFLDTNFIHQRVPMKFRSL